jgi:drug/metabolite transporter (DMT)-like permease
MDPLFTFVPMTVGATLAALPLVVRDSREERGAGAARIAGRVLFLAVALALSFARVARAAQIASPASPTLLLAVGPLTLIAALLLAVGLRRENVDSLARGEAMLMVASLPAVYVGLSLENGRGAVIVANLAVAFLGLGRIVRGRASANRAAMGEGIAIVAILFVARMAEFMRFV